MNSLFVILFGAIFIVCSIQGTPAPRVPGEISKAKCQEYSKYTEVSKKNNQKTYDCELQTDLNENFTANRKEFPHVVRIGYKINDKIIYKCVGNLISQDYVLTVAHCLKSTKPGPPVQVQLGVTDVDDTENVQTINISKIIIHPDFLTYYNDIALIKLDKPVEINSYVRPLCLNTEKDISYDEAVVSGWGNSVKGGNMSKILTKGVVSFVSNEECNKVYEAAHLKNGVVEDSMVCAAIKRGKDTCQGDSGVPLQARIKDSEELQCMYSLFGLTSFGYVCGHASSPSVYTRVSHYVKWIEDTVWPLQ